MTRTVVVLLALLVLAGCGGTPASSSSPSPAASATPSAGAGAAACPQLQTRPEVKVGRPQAAVLYGLQQGLAPDATVVQPGAGSLVGRVRPAVRMTDPAGAVSAGQRQTLDELLPGSLTTLPGTHPLRLDRPFTNRSGQNRAYAVYAWAKVWRGTWTQQLCLDPAKGVQTVRGTFTTTGSLRYGIVPCRTVGDLTVPAMLAVQSVCDRSGRMSR